MWNCGQHAKSSGILKNCQFGKQHSYFFLYQNGKREEQKKTIACTKNWQKVCWLSVVAADDVDPRPLVEGGGGLAGLGMVKIFSSKQSLYNFLCRVSVSSSPLKASLRRPFLTAFLRLANVAFMWTSPSSTSLLSCNPELC